MNTTEFIAFFTSYKKVPVFGGTWEGNPGILSNTYNGVPWEDRYIAASRLAAVDFGCRFEGNRCIAERNRSDEAVSWAMGLGRKNRHVSFCCASCYLTCGNLLILPDDTSVLTEIAKLFNPRAEGFWKTGIGCTLPSKYRSTDCLTYRCNYIKNIGTSKETLQLIVDLVNLKSTIKGG
jgi:hypothetical protein